MTESTAVATGLVFVGSLVAFAAAGIACFASVRRVRHIEDPDTRRGLTWLLVLSGSWASTHVGFLLLPTPMLKTVSYMAGLVVGLAAVGAWLYFCSAYTGRSMHRHGIVRRAAAGVFGGIVLVKLTNPLHQLYFTAEFVTSPFPHLAVQNGLFHWLVMGLSYALALVGYFILLEFFLQVSYDTKPFVVLVSITGLPVALDIIGFATPYLLDITYEPLGVAIFALGVCYVYLDRFQVIQIAADQTDPVIVLDTADRIRDYNAAAAELFPELERSPVLGEPLEAVIPTVTTAMDAETEILEFEHEGQDRYLRLTENPFGAEHAPLGRMLILTDVTHREQYRRELERQNERLDQFASMVSHDLRNPLTVAMGRLELARDEHDSDHLQRVAAAHERMAELIDDVLSLARQGQPIDEREVVHLSVSADQSWQSIASPEAELVVDGDLKFLADGDRLTQLLENLFRNAIDHGRADVTIRVGAMDDDAGFYVADDGPGIPESDRPHVFDSGYTTDETGTGFGLAIVSEIVDAHDWEIDVGTSATGGARFEITGLDVVG